MHLTPWPDRHTFHFCSLNTLYNVYICAVIVQVTIVSRLLEQLLGTFQLLLLTITLQLLPYIETLLLWSSHYTTLKSTVILLLFIQSDVIRMVCTYVSQLFKNSYYATVYTCSYIW